MTQPADALTIALLETQHRQLSSLLSRLELARRDLVPQDSSGVWAGAARHAYDSAIDALLTTVEAGVAALRSARDHTRIAIDVVAARG